MPYENPGACHAHALLASARERVMIGDGAMGTELQRAGLETGACGELWNVTNPNAVRAIHRRYIDAGSEIVLTNTFGASRIALDRHDLASRAIEINSAGARLARESGAVWVLGDIGPSGGFLEPIGDVREADLYDAFREQTNALLHGGADGIVIETMGALDEMTVALRAVRDAGAQLIVGSFTFEATKNAGLRTMSGATPESAAELLLREHADILGANCGTHLGIEDYVSIVRRYRSASPETPIMVQPNAGQPRMEGDRTMYDSTPAAMVAGTARLIDAGASIIGGCCGTTPDHIAAIASVIPHPSSRT